MKRNRMDTKMMSEREAIALARRRFSRRLVALVVIGSRSTGDARPDSDLDVVAMVTGRATDMVQGLAVWAWPKISACMKGHGKGETCRYCLVLVNWKLGRAKVIAGKNILKELPPLRDLLARDLSRELRLDYQAAVAKDSPARVLNREPRRKVGFIIAICEALLLTKGVAVKKNRLPAALKRRFPKFRTIPLLRRALWRREHWPEIAKDKRQIAGIDRDLKRFLAIFRRSQYAGGA